MCIGAEGLKWLCSQRGHVYTKAYCLALDHCSIRMHLSWNSYERRCIARHLPYKHRCVLPRMLTAHDRFVWPSLLNATAWRWNLLEASLGGKAVALSCHPEGVCTMLALRDPSQRVCASRSVRPMLRHLVQLRGKEFCGVTCCISEHASKAQS